MLFCFQATKCSSLLMERTQETGRRSMAVLASRCFYFHSRAFELDDRLEEIRPFLHSRLRSATLKNVGWLTREDYIIWHHFRCSFLKFQNHDCQAVLINLLLRNYLHYNLHDQASKLVNRVEFPESSPNNEWARFLYYLGVYFWFKNKILHNFFLPNFFCAFKALSRLSNWTIMLLTIILFRQIERPRSTLLSASNRLCTNWTL